MNRSYRPAPEPRPTEGPDPWYRRLWARLPYWLQCFSVGLLALVAALTGLAVFGGALALVAVTLPTSLYFLAAISVGVMAFGIGDAVISSKEWPSNYRAK